MKMKTLKETPVRLISLAVTIINRIAGKELLLYAPFGGHVTKNIDDYKVIFQVEKIGIMKYENAVAVFEQFLRIAKDNRWSFENMTRIKAHRVPRSDMITLTIDDFKTFSKTVMQIVQDIDHNKVKMPSETELLNFLNKGDK